MLKLFWLDSFLPKQLLVFALILTVAWPKRRSREIPCMVRSRIPFGNSSTVVLICCVSLEFAGFSVPMGFSPRSSPQLRALWALLRLITVQSPGTKSSNSSSAAHSFRVPIQGHPSLIRYSFLSFTFARKLFEFTRSRFLVSLVRTAQGCAHVRAIRA